MNNAHRSLVLSELTVGNYLPSMTIFSCMTLSFFSGNIHLTRYQAKAKKVVHIMSTQHTGIQCQVDGKRKPHTVLYYNENKFGLDMLGSMCIFQNRKKMVDRVQWTNPKILLWNWHKHGASNPQKETNGWWRIDWYSAGVWCRVETGNAVCRRQVDWRNIMQISTSSRSCKQICFSCTIKSAWWKKTMIVSLAKLMKI